MMSTFSFTADYFTSAVAQWVRAFPRKRKVRCANPSRNRPKSLKQVATAPLPNAWD